jgi:hypothetical protein
MKIYMTFHYDCLSGGEFVPDKAFDSQEKAIDHVFKTYLNRMRISQELSAEKLKKRALERIIEYKVY